MKYVLALAALLAVSAQAAPVTIAMYGDSTTMGAELYQGQWMVSPNNVPAEIRAKYSGQPVTVLNKGISGVNMPQMYYGAAPASVAWANEMASSPAHIVVINLGINDAYTAWLTDTEVDWHVRQLIAIAKSYGKFVVIQTPNPINTDHYQRVAEIAQVIRVAASDNQIFIVDQHKWIQSGIPDWPKWLPDGVHPSRGLYAIKANNVYAIINPKVQAMLAK